MEPLTLLTGAVILAAGIGLGASLARLGGHRRQPRPRQPIQAACDCRHSLSYHGTTAGACHAKVSQPSLYDLDGRTVGWEMVRCTCQRYVGPEPLPEYYAPTISQPSKDDGEPGVQHPERT